MVPYSEDRTRILENALSHYSNRVKKLAEDKDVLPDHLQNDYIRKDLLNESTKAQDLRKNLNLPQGEFSVQALDYEDNRKTACYALKCYLNDLKESVSLIKEKLGGADPVFEQVDKEISEAQKYFERICDQGK